MNPFVIRMEQSAEILVGFEEDAVTHATMLLKRGGTFEMRVKTGRPGEQEIVLNGAIEENGLVIQYGYAGMKIKTVELTH